ncbi:scavenger receptor cysteine-rich type 1 protein M130-like isoform X2 [Trachinotus anak]|uniref:scavenger receptor cysteine-rich type 1 protein M130-like isoform X2 n=1 Tax=Trachinotus anak TaxID=443729 RepID=UPI0039F1CBC9
MTGWGDMDHRVLIVLLCVWSAGLWAEDTQTSTVMPDDIRLVGGASHCAGRPEMKKQGNWTAVDKQYTNLTTAAGVCRQLNCGSVVSLRTQESAVTSSDPHIILIFNENFSPNIEITCSESVRLVNGTNLCSGRLEVKSDQSWFSVCEDDFDQQDAEVVCRELSCGAPSEVWGALYGEVGAPVWTKEFQCGGSESLLLDCDSSRPARETCSSGKAVGLTCTDPEDVRLVGGANLCAGRLELKHHGEWKAVNNLDFLWNLKASDVICGWLGCGSSVSTEKIEYLVKQPVWWLNSSCVQSENTLRECVDIRKPFSYSSLEINCSESVRLVNGTNLCSGRLEVKSDQSWSSVCEDDFDQQDAEVVCRELRCGAPSEVQGALYGEVEAPVWTKELQCWGNESLLLDCERSGSATKTCSPDKAVGLTCSVPQDIRLVEEASRCAGELQMKNQGEWRPVADWDSQWNQMSAATVCRQMDCGSMVSTEYTYCNSDRLVWWIKSRCVQSASALWDCMLLTDSNQSDSGLKVICSALLAQPNISFSPSTDGVSKTEQWASQVLMGSNFTITCATEPQYQGGSFQLIFTTADRAQNYTLPAVNHSAHFLFSAADHTHQGDYSCVYHVHVFSHNFSSESQMLYLAVSASVTDLIVRLVVVLVGIMLLITTLCITSTKASRSHNMG